MGVFLCIDVSVAVVFDEVPDLTLIDLLRFPLGTCLTLAGHDLRGKAETGTCEGDGEEITKLGVDDFSRKGLHIWQNYENQTDSGVVVECIFGRTTRISNQNFNIILSKKNQYYPCLSFSFPLCS